MFKPEFTTSPLEFSIRGPVFHCVCRRRRVTLRLMKRFHSLTGRATLFLLFMWFMWFLNFTTRTMFSPVLPIIEDEFGITHARATSIFLFTSLGYAPSVFFSSVYARVLGHRKTLIVSLLLLGLASLAIPFLHVFHLFYAVALVTGVAAGMYIPSVIPLLTEYYEESNWGKVIAVHDSAGQFSIAATPFIALLILLFFPWRAIFVVLGIGLWCSAALFYLVSAEIHATGSRRYFQPELLKNKPLWAIAIVWMFMAGSTMGTYHVAPLYLTKELGMSIERANAVFGMSRIGGVFVGIASGFLVDRFRAKKLVIALVIATGIVTGLVALKDVRWVKAFLFAQAAISAGFFPLALVHVSRVFEADLRGQAVGFLITLGVIGVGVMPFFLGLSGDLVSFRFGFVMLGAITALSAGLLCFVKELR
jgi:MFS family permease